jgi:multidrug efflux system outer membrane protein
MSAVSEIKSVRDEELRIVTEKFKVGSAGAADVAQAQVNQANAITVLSETTRIRAQALHLLGSLMGEPALTLNPIATPTMPVPPIPAAGLPSDLLRQRPDVVAAEQNLIAANARIGYVKAAYFPTFSLTGALGLESREFSAFTNSASSTSSLGVDLSVPLLDFGRTTARVDAAIALQHQAAANYEKTVLQAFREVRDALVDVRETSLAAQAAEQREIAAREAFRVAENRYQQGQMTPFDFLSARSLLAESQSAVAKVRADRVGAHVDLIKALGGSDVVEIESVAEIE